MSISAIRQQILSVNDPSIIKVAFLDVGQGDSIVILLPDSDSAILVDSAPGHTVANFLNRHGVRHIPLAVITHTHHDHMGSMLDTLRGFGGNIGALVCNIDKTVPSNANKKRKYRNFLRELAGYERSGHIKRKNALAPMSEEYSGVKISILHPEDADLNDALASGKPNNASVVLRLEYCKYAILLTGDLESQGWQLLMARQPKLSADILKLPHHGGDITKEKGNLQSSEANKLMAEINPQVIIISAGTNNRNNHPSSHIIEYLRETQPKSRILCTQATHRCHDNPANLRGEILPLISEMCNNGSSRYDKKACPCAGTIIAHINKSDLLIVPSAEEHYKVISSFSRPQCVPK
jgi:competence protein ComEC